MTDPEPSKMTDTQSPQRVGPFLRAQQPNASERLVTRFHFNLNSSVNSQETSAATLLEEDSVAAELLWKMYNRAKDLLPYEARMKNLTWRMMFFGESMSRVRRIAAHQPSAKSPKKTPLDPAADDFDYVAHIRLMTNGKHPDSHSKKRAAEFSPLMQGVVPAAAHKPHSNLSASLAAVKNADSNPDVDAGGSFAFSLDPLAFDGPNDNLVYTETSPSQAVGSFGHHSGILARENNLLVSLLDHFRPDIGVPSSSRPEMARDFSSDRLNHYSSHSISGAITPYPIPHNASFSGHQSPYTPVTASSYFDSFRKQTSGFDDDRPSNIGANMPFTFASSLPTQWNQTFLPAEETPTLHSLASSTTLLGSATPTLQTPKKALKKTRVSICKPRKASRGISPDPQPKKEPEKSTPVQCTNCRTRTTPLWRRNPEGQPLCNACGLFLKLHGVVRPLSLKTDVIKKRQRGAGNPATTKKGSLRDGDDLNPTAINRSKLDRHETPTLASSKRRSNPQISSKSKGPETAVFAASGRQPLDNSQFSSRPGNTYRMPSFDDSQNLQPIDEMRPDGFLLYSNGLEHNPPTVQVEPGVPSLNKMVSSPVDALTADDSPGANDKWDWLSMAL